MENFEPESPRKDIEVEEEYSYYEESEAEPEASHLEQAKRQELKKLRQLLRQNKQIPKVIIIQDRNGNEIEYEVLEESEQSIGHSSQSSRIGLRQSQSGVETSVEYFEEVIEESEEEPDSQIDL